MSNSITGSPGTVVQVRDVHGGGVHIHAPSPVPVPRQLPAPRLFVDRDDPRAFLEAAWAHRHGPLLAGIEGPSGIGKTAFLTDWGHHHRDRWPDGTLYADMAHTAPDTALRGWLVALGHHHLPGHPEHLRGLWRTATADRRLLVITENTSADTARDLLPVGPGCAGIATARHGLASLVAFGGRHIRLARLGPDTVRDLITRLTGGSVPAPALQEAVAAAAGMPLAAALTAAALAQHTDTTFIETNRPEAVVPARIDRILSESSPESAAAASLVAAFPGPSVTADLVGGLLDTSPGRAHQTLRELVSAAIVTDLGRGRYSVHDQVRAPLVQRLASEPRTTLVKTISHFYRVRLAAVDLVLNSWRWRADTQGAELARAAQEHGPWFASRAHALAWVDAELDNILAVARMLAQLGRPEVWMLGDHIGTYAVLRKPWSVMRELYRLGLDSARAAGDMKAVGLMLQRVSTGLHPDWQAALDLNREAETAYEEAGFEQGVASAYESIGSLLSRLDRLDEAEEAQTISLHKHESLGNRRGAAFQVRRLGEIHTRQGRTEEAKAAFAASSQTLLSLDPPDVYQATRNSQGMLDLVLGQGDPTLLPVVRMLALQALAAAQASGALEQRASLHLSLAEVSRRQKDVPGEIAHCRKAQELLEPGHPVVEQAAARLAAIEAPEA